MLPFVIELQPSGVYWLRYPDMSNPARTATREEIAMWELLQGLEDATAPTLEITREHAVSLGLCVP